MRGRRRRGNVQNEGGGERTRRLGEDETLLRCFGAPEEEGSDLERGGEILRLLGASFP